MADINAIAQQFTDFYYLTFDTDRSHLAPLYVRRFSFSLFRTVPDTISRLLISLSRHLYPPCSLPKRDGSMLTFEGTPIQGVSAIIEKLTVNPFTSATCSRLSIFFSCFATQSLPFQKVQHKVTTRDAQPSSNNVASLIVSVTGLLLVGSGRKSPWGLLHSSPTV